MKRVLVARSTPAARWDTSGYTKQIQPPSGGENKSRLGAHCKFRPAGGGHTSSCSYPYSYPSTSRLYLHLSRREARPQQARPPNFFRHKSVTKAEKEKIRKNAHHVAVFARSCD